MKKHKGIILLLILLLMVIVFIIRIKIKEQDDAHYSAFKPRVEMNIFKINKITQEETDMDIKILISNPIPVGVRMDSLRYKIYIAGKEVVSSSYPNSVEFKGNDSSLITLPVIAKNEKLKSVLKDLENKHIDSTDYKIIGDANFSFMMVKNKPHHFEFTKRLPVIYIPEVTVSKIKIEKLGMKNSRIMIVADVDNPNIFPLEFKKTSYIIIIGKDTLSTGNIDSLISIAAKSKTTVHMPADSKPAQALGALWNKFFVADADYFFLMKTKIVAKDKSVDDSKMIIEAKGKLKDLNK